ncbi:MAG: hypothetical protein MRECE_2c067 [Mycoplasmataceae bacterium CE_OT135]|nr:MAG: hypothetical protein MRECE_2c067 [Mycoplasmataceae bacterium CE_OT135]
MALSFPNRKRKFCCYFLLFLFLIKLILLICLWITNEILFTGGVVKLGRLILIFLTFLLTFSGFCLWGLFSRLKIKKFAGIDWALTILFFLPVLILLFSLKKN